MDLFFDDFRMNMKYYREKRKISQVELAGLCECGTGTIGGIEAGKAKPSFDMMAKIANALEVNPADLFVRDACEDRENLKSKLKLQFENILRAL